VAKFVTPKVVLALAATNLILIVALVAVSSASFNRERFRPTRFETVWFDSKTAQICSARHRVRAASPSENPLLKAYTGDGTGNPFDGLDRAPEAPLTQGNATETFAEFMAHRDADTETITASDGTILDKGNHLPFCSDLK
jgi:hypothetical protein